MKILKDEAYKIIIKKIHKIVCDDCESENLTFEHYDGKVKITCDCENEKVVEYSDYYTLLEEQEDIIELTIAEFKTLLGV